MARDHQALITIKKGAVGGFGSHVAHLLAEDGVFDTGLRFRSVCRPDTVIDHAAPEAMYADARLAAADIVRKVLEVGVEGKRA